MQVIIMAAGSGTRLMPLTKNKPKAMIDIAGKPLLEHTLEQLTKLTPKIKKIIMVTGYIEEAIKVYFKDNFQGIPIHYVTQHERKGTGHAVLVTEKYINKEDGKFLVINGDDLYSHKDLQKLTKHQNCILLHELEDVSAFGVVTVDKEGKVTGMLEKPQGKAPSNLINVGAYSFTCELFEILKGLGPSSRGEVEITDAILLLAKQHKMHHVKVSEFWKPVGYPWHILNATETILEHNSELNHGGTVEAGAIVEPEVSINVGSVIKKGARVTGLVNIGKNVIIEENSTIVGPTSIADGCHIKSNCLVESSVVGKKSILQENSSIHHSVIGDGVTVHSDIHTIFHQPEQTIKMQVKGKVHNTNLNQLGVIVADDCQVTEDTSPGQIIQ